MKLINSAIVLSFFLAFLGCKSTHITSTWKAPDAAPKNYNNVMVLGIIREADRSFKERMEGHLADDLKTLGYNASSAFQAYGPKSFEGMSEEQANKKLAADGIDAVITVVLLDKKKERHYVPGRVVYTPYVMYHNRLWGYYHSIYTRIGDPGYYEVTTKYFWESNFYDLSANKLLYSIQTQSFEPSSADALAHEYGKEIIQEMVKDQILQKQEEKPSKAM